MPAKEIYMGFAVMFGVWYSIPVSGGSSQHLSVDILPGSTSRSLCIQFKHSSLFDYIEVCGSY